MNLLDAVYPNFPTDRKVESTQHFDMFWKIAGRTLYVPSQHILHSRYDLLDTYIEAVNNFASIPVHELDMSMAESWNTNRLMRYVCTTEDDVQDALITLRQQKYLACDIETSDVSYNGNKLLLLGIAWSPTEAVAITIFTPQVVEWLNSLFAAPNIRFIWHNGKFDTTRLKYLSGITARIDEDTLLMHYVGINEKKGTHGLKDLASLYLQAPAWEDALKEYKKTWCRQNKIKLSDFKYSMFPRSVIIPYLHLDCIATYRLCFRFKKLMREGTETLYRMVIRAANTFKDIELAGNYVDQEYINELEQILKAEIDTSQKDLAEAVDRLWDPVAYAKETATKSYSREFNERSPKQLKWLLEKIAGRQLASSDKFVMEELIEEFPDEPFLKAISNLRKARKYLDTYVIGIRDSICPDGRIRCTYNLHGTETGRLSSDSPNMQNIPRNKLIKNIFVAAPGRKLIQLDYSQAELRVLAYLSQDTYLKDTYKRGEDLHGSMARAIFGEGFTKEQRVAAKTVNFGIPYGRGAGSIASMLNMSFGEAAKLIQDWFRAAPGAKVFVDTMRALPTKGEVYTTPFGRQRHFIITNENLNGVQNESVNFPIQSIASDCTVNSIMEIHDFLLEKGYDAFICNTVHDSIIIDCIDDEKVIADVAKQAKIIMETVPSKYLTDLDFPFVADESIGVKWGELE